MFYPNLMHFDLYAVSYIGVLNVLEGSDREIDMKPGLSENDI